MSDPGDSTSGPLQREVCFSGRVQGVGFRYTACSIAVDYNVTGYVRNLSSGKVLLVAEGADGEVRRFIDAIQREMGGYIDDIETHDRPATGQYYGFTIAR